MNHLALETRLPVVNRVVAAPRTDVRLHKGGRFESDAGFRVDHYFCNRLNVAAVGSEPKCVGQKAQVHNFTVQTDPRPIGRTRVQDACFATVAAPATATHFDRSAAGTVTTETENLSESALRGSLVSGEPQVEGYTMAELEKLAITQTLERCAGNRTKAARMLGISVRTLQRKLNSWKSRCI